MLATWPPFLVARRTFTAIRSRATLTFLRRRQGCATTAVVIALVVAIGARTIPPSFALTEALLARGIAGVPQLAALEPFQLRAGMFLAQAIEGRKQFLDVMRSKRCRLIVDDDRPVRVSRRHSHNLTSMVPRVPHVPQVPRVPRVPGGCGYSCAVELIVAPIAELRRRLTARFEDVVREALADGDSDSAEPSRFACGVTGGSTALIFLAALRDADVVWPRITLYWGDERAVPPTIPTRTTASQNGCSSRRSARARPHAERMEGESPDLRAAARALRLHASPPRST